MEDPFAVSPSLSALSRHRADPFNWHSTTPALNLSEENDSYIVEAEVPGVRRENLDLRIGDGGRSLTIEGRVARNNSTTEVTASATTPSTEAGTSSVPTPEKPIDAVARVEGKSHSTETKLSGQKLTSSPDETKQVATNPWSRSFTRTVWLPHRIDTNNVSAKLDHGVLTVKAVKAKDQAVNITVE